MKLPRVAYYVLAVELTVFLVIGALLVSHHARLIRLERSLSEPVTIVFPEK